MEWVERGKTRSGSWALGISKASGCEGDGEGAASEVQRTNRGSSLPEAREDNVQEGERSTLLTAAGSSKINHWEWLLDLAIGLGSHRWPWPRAFLEEQCKQNSTEMGSIENIEQIVTFYIDSVPEELFYEREHEGSYRIRGGYFSFLR